MEKLIEGVQYFQDKVFPGKRSLFQKLAKGQQPETLVITCADSRIALELVTQSGPGELFVCRNAGNIVPSYEVPDANSASIEYALSVLPIRDIIVCGHSDCGAMKGLLHPHALSEMPQVRNWLANARGALHGLERSSTGRDSPESLTALTKLNILLQLEHLHTYPQVFARVREGSLRLHGWFYQIDAGELLSWEATEGSWVSLRRQPAVLKYRAAGSQEIHHA